jgi:predicted permease
MRLKEGLRYALRQLVLAPGFTVTAVLTLALGIGATTAIFTLVHAVLLKSLPVSRPEELYRVGDNENCCVNGGMQDSWSLFSYDKYETFRDGTTGFLELAAFQAGRGLAGVRRVGRDEPAEPQRTQYVSGNYFSMFGVGAYVGRVLTPEDDRPGAEPVAVMSYRTWQGRYGLDPSVVGSTFTLSGQPFTVVGVTPKSFSGDRLENMPAFWLPLQTERLLDRTATLLDFPNADWLDLIGRIARGADPRAIEAQLQAQLRQWLLSPVAGLDDAEKMLVPKQTLRLTPGGAGVQMMREEYESGLRLLFAVSGFVLLIACANVANLMLVRAASRRQQISLRTALGAPRSRQLAQALIESTCLSLLGGIVGVAFAIWGTSFILRLAFRDLPVAIDPMPSFPVLGFTFGVCLLTGILFGIAPAWLMARMDPADALRGTHRATASFGWTQKSLVVAQAALSLVLLCAAGLLTQSLRNMRNQDFGFEVDGRYILHIDPAMAGYRVEELSSLYRKLRESLGAIPGVSRVSFALYSPMEGDNWGETVYIEGQPPPPAGSYENGSSWLRVSDGYFEAVGTRIVKGRGITEQDTASSRNVAVVNETFARKFFKDGDPIGKRFGDLDPKYAGNFEIVGVTEDTQYREATREIPPTFFLPEAQKVLYDEPRFQAFENRSHYLGAVVIQTEGALTGFEPQVRRAISQVNPDLAVIDFKTFAAQVEANFAQQAMLAKLTSLFGLVALALASVGLYGVTAYTVERRTGEIGIRMALGADASRVLKLVLRGAFAQIGIGLLIGVPATIATGYAMTTQLFGVKPYSPGVLLTTTLVLSFAALAAALVPARRAAMLSAIRALRTE